MRRFEQLVREIHRRSLWQVLALYAAGSWVAIEVVGELTDTLALPDWVPPLAIALLVLELPVVVATAFVQEGVGGGGAGSASGLPAEGLGRDPGDLGDARDRGEAAGTAGGDDGRRRSRRIFTWRNVLWTAGGAFALFGLATAGWAASRALGIGPAATLVSRGVLEEREPVVLAEFENATPDSLLGETVAEALRIDLLQSPTLTVLELPRIEEALRRMGRERSASLELPVAREVAVREGVKAVITGQVRAAGTGYVLSAELVAADDGRSLAAVSETAEGPDALIAAIARLSRSLRERVGEPLRTIRAGAPLERVSTASLEALRLYTAGVRAVAAEGDRLRAAELYERAVALDSTFAMAYRKLGMTGRVSRARRIDALRRAYRHRDRLVERERLHVEGSYHATVGGDYLAAIAAYRALLAGDPEDLTARHNLAEMLYRSGDLEGAVTEMRRAMETDPTAASYGNLVIYLWNAGRYGEAEAVAEEMRERFPENLAAGVFAVGHRTAMREYESADSTVDALRGELEGDDARLAFARLQTWIDAVRGRLDEAEAHLEELVALATRRELWTLAYEDALGMAELSVWSRRDPDAAVREAEALLARYPLEELDALDRPYLSLARLFARAGRPDRAEAYLAEYAEAVPPELRGDDRGEVARARGLLALERGRPHEAIDAFRKAATEYDDSCRLCPASDLAAAFDRAGKADSAVAYYERYLDTPWATRISEDWVRLPYALERLARLHDERGETEKAAARYAEFVELWEGADPQLRPRVEAARARLQEILAARG